MINLTPKHRAIIDWTLKNPGKGWKDIEPLKTKLGFDDVWDLLHHHDELENEEVIKFTGRGWYIGNLEEDPE